MTVELAGRQTPQWPLSPVRLSPEETIARLTHIPRGQSPREALEAAIVWREEITPRLLEELALAPVDVQDLGKAAPEGSSYCLHTLSFYLLALFREPRAFATMLDYFASDADLAEDISGEALSGDLPAMLVRCWDGRSLATLRLMIETDAFGPIFRHECLQAYHGLALAGHVDKAEVVAFAGRLLDAIPDDATYHAWYGWLALSAAELQAPELRARIDDLFDRGLHKRPDDRFNFSLVVEKDDIASIYDDRSGRRAASILRDSFFDNFVDKVCRWWWFQPARQRSALDSTLDAVLYDQPYERTAPKVGRNDPCPCGSGKKYKKCCLN